MIVSEDYDVRQSRRVLELQNRDLWIRPRELSWYFPILVTIRECPSEITVEGHPRSWRPERTRSRKSRSRRLWKTETRIGIQTHGNRLGRGLLHPHLHLLRDENGAQTKRVSILIDNHQPIGRAQTRRVSVLIGSQLIWTAPIKCVRLRHDSRTIHDNEVIFIDPHKDIHGDENNVCLWRSTSFRHFCHLSCYYERRVRLWLILFIQRAWTCFDTPFLSFLWTFDSRPIS